MNNKSNSIIFLIIGLVVGGFIMHFCSNYTVQRKNETNNNAGNSAAVNSSGINPNLTKRTDCWNCGNNSQVQNSNTQDITKLSEENLVANFIHQNKKLPAYYITKSNARKQGWNPSAGNLCEALPGKVIGGDHFSNREKALPENAQYFEADVNFHCGNRQADRLIFTKNGDVWVTHDHYKTFQKI